MEELIVGILKGYGLPGLVVAAGDSFPILTYSSRSGTFASIVFDDLYLDNMFDVVYTPTAVVLVAQATTGVDLHCSLASPRPRSGRQSSRCWYLGGHLSASACRSGPRVRSGRPRSG